MYGEKYTSFGGWYISGEISRKTKGAIEGFHAMGKQCKDVSGGLPTFISPWIDGKKAIMGTGKLTNDQAVSVAEHETNCGTGRHHTRQAPQTTLPTI